MPPRLVKITADSSVTLISADFFFFLLLFFFRSLNPDACLSTADPLRTPLDWRTRLQVAIDIAAALVSGNYHCTSHSLRAEMIHSVL